MNNKLIEELYENFTFGVIEKHLKEIEGYIADIRDNYTKTSAGDPTLSRMIDRCERIEHTAKMMKGKIQKYISAETLVFEMIGNENDDEYV
jgi:hypothetical protein